MKMKTILVCNECRGTNIQVLAWIDANTNEYKGECGLGNDDKWCEDCDEFVRFDLVEKKK